MDNWLMLFSLLKKEPNPLNNDIPWDISFAQKVHYKSHASICIGQICQQAQVQLH